MQVVEARVAGPTVPARHVRQTLALPGHGVAAALLVRRAVGIAGAGWDGETERTTPNHQREREDRLFRPALSSMEAAQAHTGCLGDLNKNVPAVETHTDFAGVWWKKNTYFIKSF